MKQLKISISVALQCYGLQQKITNTLRLLLILKIIKLCWNKLKKLAKLESIDWLDADQAVPATATQLHQNVEILVPLAGLIDVKAERVRLQKEITKLQSGLQAVRGKLGNTKFVNNAPAAVVARERGKETQMSAALSALQQKLEQLAAL